MRRLAPRLPLPDSLAGKRCLDVGTASGFWAFEMERRGAAEVVAIDVDDATRWDWQRPSALADADADAGRGYVRRGFELAREALGSNVSWRELSVYDVTEDEPGGRFDFIFCGNLLLHLRDPVGALRRLRGITSGSLLSLEPVALLSTLVRPRRPVAQLWHGDDARWWTPNAAAHRRWTEAAGFEVEHASQLHRQRFGEFWRQRPAEDSTLAGKLRFALVRRPLGVPSTVVLARTG